MSFHCVPVTFKLHVPVYWLSLQGEWDPTTSPLWEKLQADYHGEGAQTDAPGNTLGSLAFINPSFTFPEVLGKDGSSPCDFLVDFSILTCHEELNSGAMPFSEKWFGVLDNIFCKNKPADTRWWFQHFTRSKQDTYLCRTFCYANSPSLFRGSVFGKGGGVYVMEMQETLKHILCHHPSGVGLSHLNT